MLYALAALNVTIYALSIYFFGLWVTLAAYAVITLVNVVRLVCNAPITPAQVEEHRRIREAGMPGLLGAIGVRLGLKVELRINTSLTPVFLRFFLV